MKTLVLKETRAPYSIKGKQSVSYTLTLDEAALAEGPVQVLRVENGGEQVVGILVSPEEYATFRAWREVQQCKAQGQQAHEAAHEAFKREVEAFERMKPELLEKYHNRVVAIHEGQVVEVGDSKEKVSERVHQRLGDIVVYIQWVLEHPRVYKFPYFKVIR